MQASFKKTAFFIIGLIIPSTALSQELIDVPSDGPSTSYWFIEGR